MVHTNPAIAVDEGEALNVALQAQVAELQEKLAEQAGVIKDLTSRLATGPGNAAPDCSGCECTSSNGRRGRRLAQWSSGHPWLFAWLVGFGLAALPMFVVVPVAILALLIERKFSRLERHFNPSPSPARFSWRHTLALAVIVPLVFSLCQLHCHPTVPSPSPSIKHSTASTNANAPSNTMNGGAVHHGYYYQHHHHHQAPAPQNDDYTLYF